MWHLCVCALKKCISDTNTHTLEYTKKPTVMMSVSIIVVQFFPTAVFLDALLLSQPLPFRSFASKHQRTWKRLNYSCQSPSAHQPTDSRLMRPPHCMNTYVCVCAYVPGLIPCEHIFAYDYEVHFIRVKFSEQFIKSECKTNSWT